MMSPFNNSVQLPTKTLVLLLVFLIPLSCCGESDAQSQGHRLVSYKADLVDWTEHLLDSSQVVADAKCDVSSVRQANSKQLHSILEEMLNMTFFRLFKVPAEGECPLAKKRSSSKDTELHKEIEELEEETCGSGDRGGPLAASGIFGQMQSSSKMFGSETSGRSKCEVETIDEKVESRITKEEEDALLTTPYLDTECDDESEPTFWLNMCSNIPSTTSEYINLQLNPEHYTGYNGSKIWNAIYSESCFKPEDPEEMCYEERVLYRLLSGLHTSINTHISLYYEPETAERDVWIPNPERFVRVVGSHPDRVNNLHFAFVVLLRAIKKVSPRLRNYDFSMGIAEEDSRTTALVNHLLDSQVLKSCENVFNAFDESLLFQEEHLPTLITLKRNFKNVFHNISDIFNCVKCQRCRLHGKMQLLGVGTALKLLLLPDELITLSRDEVVALFNTLGKFSESLEAIPVLVQLYWQKKTTPINTEENTGSGAASPIETLSELTAKKGLALKAVKLSMADGLISSDQENTLVDAVLDAHEDLMILIEQYGDNPEAFVRHALRRVSGDKNIQLGSSPNSKFDAVVVGGGLAGLTTALTLLDRGGRVAIVDKESFLGGNSAKASSGINGIDENSVYRNDSVEEFERDVLIGGGRSPDDSIPLVKTLTGGSVDALRWLRTRCGLPLEMIGQLGGHSHPRTHRPSKGLAGAELVTAVQSLLQEYSQTNRLLIFKKTKVIKLIRSSSDSAAPVTGVKCQNVDSKEEFNLAGDNVVIATGGYGYDTSPESLLNQHRSDLTKFATTNGKFATGDGIKLVQGDDIQGKLVDLAHVQLHPTGFIDPSDLKAKVKKLCAELLRGVGGIILDPTGQRFANELGTRDYLSNRMLKQQPGVEQPAFTLVLNRIAAEKAQVHVPMYLKRKLLKQFDSLEQVADWMNISSVVLKATFAAYDDLTGTDEFGKTEFPSTPFSNNGPYYVGLVTPVLHYCMGGIEIQQHGEVVDRNGNIIPGLYAAGEVTGGVHGKNRLGGNALTECVVFGRQVGMKIPLIKTTNALTTGKTSEIKNNKNTVSTLSIRELQKHSSRANCWVQIQDLVYDLTNFIDEHPAGAEPILELCGMDGTEEFEEIHSIELLKGFAVIGKIAQ